MRILQVITKSELGGSQAVVRDLSIGLAERGHQVMIASGPEGDDIAWDGLPDSIERARLHRLVREVRPKDDLLAVAELTGLYRSWRPDIVNLHTSKAGAIGRLARGLPRRQIVYTMHGFGQLAVANAKLLRVDRLLRSQCGAIVAVSRADQVQMADAGYRTRLIVNGTPDMRADAQLDPELAADLASARAAGRPVFLMAAREAPPKRVDLARAAAAQLGDVATIMWAGGDPQPQDPPNFKAIGFVNVRPLLEHLDGYLLLSDHEGLPVSLLEALSAGLPCVASAVPGILEALDMTTAGRGRVGITVPNDVAAITTAIAEVSDDMTERSQMAQAARELWRERYSVDTMARNYEALYDELLARRGAS